MAHYVDGFVIPVPKKKLPVYLAMAKIAAQVWKDHGALDYKECVAEDSKPGFGLPFSKAIKSKPSEVIVFSYIVYKSRAHRDKVNAKAMKDERLANSCDPTNMPFDCDRMAYGGFNVTVSL
jgi:uncharacterized protein YbaA (DUF1428 family)